MTRFDKKVKRLSKDFHVSESYHKKVDDILEEIMEYSVLKPKKKPYVKVAVGIMALCLFITGSLLLSGAKVAEAGFFETFKQTIMDFFGIEQDESQKIGVGSKREEAVSKPDLMIELQEVVADMQSIYAVVKITAPPTVEFKENMTFDYFGFCEGTNYNVSSVIPGSRDCTLLEVLKEQKNVATYVVDISTNEQIQDGEEMTVFFKDLIAGQYEEKPEILVEGMWSLSFSVSYTNTKNITVDGTEDMKYSFADTTADIKKIQLLPLSLTFISDVSNVDVDTLHTTDTRITIRMKMIDGSEVIVDSPDLDKEGLVNGGSIGEYEEMGKRYQKYVGQFRKAIDISRVLGIYIADYYVMLKEYE